MTYSGLKNLNHPITQTVNENDIRAHLLRKRKYQSLYTLLLNFAGEVTEEKGNEGNLGYMSEMRGNTKEPI